MHHCLMNTCTTCSPWPFDFTCRNIHVGNSFWTRNLRLHVWYAHVLSLRQDLSAFTMFYPMTLTTKIWLLKSILFRVFSTFIKRLLAKILIWIYSTSNCARFVKNLLIIVYKFQVWWIIWRSPLICHTGFTTQQKTRKSMASLSKERHFLQLRVMKIHLKMT